MKMFLGASVGLICAGAWIFIWMAVARVLVITFVKIDRWWAFPLYMGLFVPWAAIFFGGLAGCLWIAFWIAAQ